MKPSTGIHHITAVSGDPVENWRFYTQVLGERMVKKTVNFDDPGTYHLYYGDKAGSPGTLLTFFPWTRLPRRQTGVNQVSAVTYAASSDQLEAWKERLTEAGAEPEAFERWGVPGILFRDPHGMPLEIVGLESPPETPVWEQSPLAPEIRLRGFHSATLRVSKADPTLQVLTEGLGLKIQEQNGARTRLQFDSSEMIGQEVDVLEDPDGKEFGLGAGVIHHIAFRAEDKTHEAELRERMVSLGLQPTGHVDRDYFLSVYFHEPSGILFEIATDPPGFTRDEPLEDLGGSLKLPRQHEHRREELERTLPPIPPVD